MQYLQTSMGEDTNVDRALETVFRCSRQIGIFPFDTHLNLNSRRIFVSAMVLFLSASLSSIVCMTPAAFDGVTNIQIRRVIKLIGMNVSNVASFCYTIRNKSVLRKLRETLIEVEEAVNKISPKWVWRQSIFKIYVYPSVLIVKFALNFVILSVRIGLIYGLSIMTAFPVVVVLFSNLTTFSGLLNLAHSLQWRISKIHSVDDIIVCHEKIIAICGMSNDIFRVQVFLFTMNIFLFSVSSVYFEIIKVIKDYECFIQCIWLFVFMFPFVDLVMSCRKNMEQVMRNIILFISLLI